MSDHHSKMKSTDLDAAVVEPEDQRGHHDDADQHDDRGVHDLRRGRPGDLAHLALHLARGTAPGAVRSVCGSRRRRALLGRARACRRPACAICRLVCRFMSAVDASLGSGEVGVESSRAGGTRTPNRRFWRPVLYQLSYCPPGAGAGPIRIAAARPGVAGRGVPGPSRPAAQPARRMRPLARPGDQQRGRRAGGDRGAADRTGVREAAARQQRAARAVARPPRSSAASVSPSRPGRRLGVPGAQQRERRAAAGGSGRARPGSAGSVSTWRCGVDVDRVAVDQPGQQRRRPRHTASSLGLLRRTARRAACAAPGAAAPSRPTTEIPSSSAIASCDRS